MRLPPFPALACLALFGTLAPSPAQEGVIPPGDYDTTPLKQTPWEPTLPRDYTKDKLTAADWVGPDGIIYPNWTWAGVHTGKPGERQRGIPTVTNMFGMMPAKLAGEANGEAFTETLARAIKDCGEAGGGVIMLPPGEFTLTRPLIIPYDRIIIRGSGRGKAVEPGGRNDEQETRIRFSFAFGVGDEPAVKIVSYPEQGRITKESKINFYTQAFSTRSSFKSQQPNGRASHIVGFYATFMPSVGTPFTYAVSREKKEKGLYDHWEILSGGGPAMAGQIFAEKLPSLAAAEEVKIAVKVVRRWLEDGVQQEETVESEPVTFSCKDFGTTLPLPMANFGNFWEPVTSALTFCGSTTRFGTEKNWLLKEAKRGDFDIVVDLPDMATATARGFVPGAMVRVNASSSIAWAKKIERDGGRGVPRDQMVTVLAVAPADGGGIKVTLEQPLRLDFPVAEEGVDEWNEETRGYDPTGTRSTQVNVVAPIQESGVEDLVLEQTAPIWFNGINIVNAMNCWLKNVRVERAGRNPMIVQGIMNEVRDCEFIDPIWANNTGQGSAYVSGGSFGLIDNVYTRNCRHAPNFSGNTAGVVRNSRFDSSDLQWHNEWGREHLLENITVDALKGTGSYGYAAFAQRNIVDVHGPGMGQRNCLYNSDLIGISGGIFLGGKTENPLILHNRVRTVGGAALILRYHIFNGIFMNNVFAVEDRFEPAVLFGEPGNPQDESSRLASPRGGAKPKIHPGLGTANPGNDFIGNTIYGGNGEIAGGVLRFGGIRSDWRRSYGNTVLPWSNDVPRPAPKMASVYEEQLKNPKGYPDMLPVNALYNPDPAFTGKADKGPRVDGTAVYQVNFTPERPANGEKDRDPLESKPGADWLEDRGEEFGERAAGAKYGWVNGTPALMFYQPFGKWNDEDMRYRTTAEWGAADDLRPVSEWETNRDLAWQILLPPGDYEVYVAFGSTTQPRRFDREDRPLKFLQRNDFLLNDVPLQDPGQTDVRLDAFWTTVTVGDDWLLKLRPAPTAITPRVAFLQIYKAE